MQKKKTPDSKIINVFFESQISNPSKPTLELYDIKNIFKVFGKIIRILIFDRRQMIKAFVEFESASSTHLAISTIHGTKINNFGECRVTSSEKSKLEFKNNHIEFIDYSINKSNKTNSLKKSAYEYEVVSRRSTEDEGVNVFNEFEGIRNMMNSLGSESFLKNENNSFLNNLKKKNYSFQQEKNNFYKKNIKEKTASLKHDLSKTKNSEKSKVVVVSNLQDLSTADEIHKIFSNFGDINKILFMTNKNNAFIEFTSLAYAQNSILFMNQQKIIKSTIVVSYSRTLTELDLRKNMRSPKAKLYNQAFKVPNEIKRFLNNYQICINKPSRNVLAILKKSERISPEFLREYLDGFVKCRSFTVLSCDEDVVKIEIEYGEVCAGIFIMAKCGFLVIEDSKMILFFN